MDGSARANRHAPRRQTVFHPACGHPLAVVVDVDPRRPSGRNDRAAAKRWSHDAGVPGARIEATGLHDVAEVLAARPAGCPCRGPVQLPDGAAGSRWVEVAGPSPQAPVPADWAPARRLH